MATCRKCGRQGSGQYSSDGTPGLYCSNFGACRKRRERAARAQAIATEKETDQ